MRIALAHEIDALMRHARLDLATAADRALRQLAPFGTGGLIAVGVDGAVAAPFTTAAMPHAMRVGDSARRRDPCLTTSCTPSRSRSSSPGATSSRRSSARAGDREAAAVLAKLPKPTPAAWAANQVAREQPGPDRHAARRRRRAPRRAGRRARRRRRREPAHATQAERRAVDDVMRVAVKLKPAGKPLSRAMADRLRTTLHAAAGDPSCARRCRPAGSWGRRRRAARGRSRSRRPVSPLRRRSRSPRRSGRPPTTMTPPQREAEARAERERLALEDELREARGTLKVRERVAKGAEEDAQDGGRSARRRAGRARPGPARRSRTQRPSRSQRSACSRAPARSATRPATPSRGSKNAWIDGAPPLGSSRRWLN